MKYYTQTPIQGRGGEDYSSQGVGTKPETTKNLLKLMPDRQPREPEKDYVRRLIASGMTTEQLDVDMIRMRLQAKERIQIPRSMTVAEWASQYLPSPGENPIDESISASSNLVRTGMTSMLMAVNNLLDKGATPTDLEKFFGMNPKGGDLAAGWRIWNTEHRRMELILYDRRRASELKEKGQNNKEETPPNYYRDPREERKDGNSQDGTYSPEPHTSPTRRKEWKGQGHAIPHGGAEGEDQVWEPVYSPACTQPTTEEPPTTRPLKIGPLSYSAPAGMKYYTQTPIQGRGGEDYSSQGVGTKLETTKNLLKLMPDRQPREPEKDYVRRLIASGMTTEQLDVDMIRMRLQAKERIQIPRSMTVAEWASQYLPSPGENPID
ncbi:unnamed protein product [Arctogadus glacialis]